MANSSFVGLNKLEGFSCEIKPSNQGNEEKNCILNFKVEDETASEEIKMVISRPGLEVLLDGLHKIQSQLTNVAKKNKA